MKIGQPGMEVLVEHVDGNAVQFTGIVGHAPDAAYFMNRAVCLMNEIDTPSLQELEDW